MTVNGFNLCAFADEAADGLSEQISALHDNGFSGIEIRGVSGKNIVDYPRGELSEIKRELDDGGISVWAIGSPIGKINIGDSFEKHLDRFKKTVETACLLEAKNIRLFSFFTDNSPQTCKNEVIERLGAFVSAARGSGVELCHENEKDIYGDTAIRCLEIHDAFPELRAIFDPANFIQCGEDALKAWNALKKYVKYVHVKDALADGVVVPAGEGIGNLKTILGEYKKLGGTTLSLEPHLFDFIGLDKLERGKALHKETYKDSRAAFDGAAGALKRLIADLERGE